MWISFAQFELSIGGDDHLETCRLVYREANNSMKNNEEKEERLMLLESWREYEVGYLLHTYFILYVKKLRTYM